MQEIASQLRSPHGTMAEEIASFMEKSNEGLFELVLQQVKMHESDDIVEIGQANGAYVKKLVNDKTNHHYTGIDLSKEMTIASEKRNEALVRSGRARFIEADVMSIHLQDFADIILTSNTLYFWDDPNLFFQWAAKALRHNGQLGVGIRTGTSMKALPFTKYGFKFFEKSDLEMLFLNAGFHDVKFAEQIEQARLPDDDRIDLVNLAGTGIKRA